MHASLLLGPYWMKGHKVKTERVRITLNTIRDLKPQYRDWFVWDTDARGLGIKISPTGALRWVFQYHLLGRNRRLTLGDATSLTPYDARKQAKKWYAEVGGGRCPATEKKSARHAQTMSEMFDKFMDEHSRPNNKPSTVRANEGRIKTTLKPHFGKMRVCDVTMEDIVAFKHKLAKIPTTFNRALALLRKAFKLSVRVWKWRTDNPCDGVIAYPENEKDRVLTASEMVKIAEGLNRLESSLVAASRTTSAVDALRLQACQGFRVSEVRCCRWSSIVWEREEMMLADTKTGKRGIPLGPITMAVLRGIRDRQTTMKIKSSYVCPSPQDPRKPVSYTAIRDALNRKHAVRTAVSSTPLVST